ncbi:MAG: FMN-binding negative transcriptional regulator [Acidobacteria bacterium]|nr:FMN-binding negative transcriptional regulator [Acidobacteriota bacterium]
MYVPVNFAVSDDEAWRVVTDAGAGMLVITASEGLASVFVPVLVSEDRRSLSAHVAKANPWWKSASDGSDVLALFVAASAYVSPRNYPSRFENPNTVPTWNYAAAEVRGTLTLHTDLQWKHDQVRSLTHHFEQGSEEEWLVDDLDARYRDGQLQAIVGIEITVTSIEAKAKLSQNRQEIDRLNVRANFEQGTLVQRGVAARMNPPD